MGTNYYRIVTEEEMLARKNQLIYDIQNIELTPSRIQRQFSAEDPWHIFLESSCIHLGKRSSGWKFCWNFHDNKYYTNKEELFKFIREGRVVDEYGDEINVEEFIEMALNWGNPDGKIIDENHRKKMRLEGIGDYFLDSKYDDKIIDGLRVSSATDFS